MKKLTSLSYAIIGSVAALPTLALAQAPTVTFANPLAANSIQGLLVSLLEVVIVIAVPIIVLFIIYAGFMYVTARGNPTKIQNATRALTYALIGGILIIGAAAIAQIVRNIVSAF